MGDLIVNYIFIHAVHNDFGDAFEAGGGTPAIVFFNQSEHNVVPLCQSQDHIFDEDIAIA